jgi:hypothetical protein
MSKLADLIHGASKEQEAAELSAILGDGTVSAGGRGKFSRACGEAQKATAERELSMAQEELIQHPELVDTDAGKGHFFAQYKNAPVEELRDLINRVSAFRHPSGAADGSPVAERGEIARRSR